jgi:hypothetical protein
MREGRIGTCALCRSDYLLSHLRIVRYATGDRKAYALVCAMCQQNALHARTPSEEHQK